MLNVAIIGTGQISELHLKFLKNFEPVHLHAICDLSPALSRHTASRFGIDNWFTDYRQMLKEANPHVVHILTPPQTHPGIIRDCLEADAHVIAEKPLTTTHKEFEALFALARRKNRLLIEDHNYLFNRPVQSLAQLASGNKLGEIKEVEVRMALDIRDPSSRYADPNFPHPSHRLPAGVIHEFITHLCYLALHFMPSNNGKPFDRIHAEWNNYGANPIFKYDDLDALIFKQGVHARIRFCANQWPDCFSISVRGTKGTARTDLFQPYLQIEVPRRNKQLAPNINQWKTGWHLIGQSGRNLMDKLRQRTSYEGLSIFLEKTYRSMLLETEPPISYENMRDVSLLIEELVKGVEVRL